MERRISTYICITLFIHLFTQHPAWATAEPQKEMAIQQMAPHLYRVELESSPPATASAQMRLTLPTALHTGFVVDDVTRHCTINIQTNMLVCAHPVPSKLTFEWDTRAVLERHYCQTVFGTPQAKHDWHMPYTFATRTSAQWIQRIEIEGLSADELLTHTVADVANSYDYVMLWPWGEITDPSAPVQRFGLGGSAPYAGVLESFDASEAQLNLMHVGGGAVQATSVQALVCAVPHLASSTVDFTLNALYDHADQSVDAVEVAYPRMRFSYDDITVVRGVQPSLTATASPTFIPTTTFTPTPYVVQSTPVIATSTPQPSASTQTPTPFVFTPTPLAPTGQVAGIMGQGSARAPTSKAPGSVLAEQTTSTPAPTTGGASGKEQGMTLHIMVLLALCAPAVYVGMRLLRTRARHVVICCIFAGWVSAGAHTVCAAPITLVKITNALHYNARSQGGGVEHITYPPLFNFAGAVPGGRVVLSSTPDGTGYVSLGNGGYMARTLVKWSTTQHFGMGPPTGMANCSAAQNIPPVELPLNYFSDTGTQYHVSARFQGYCPSGNPWYVSDLYLVYFPPAPSPTQTPTPTSTPTPTPTIAPFLDLPWDYAASGLTFTQAALRMTAYFDHEYPTLSVGGVMDPDDFIITYVGEKERKSYSSHDGYDYALISGVRYGDAQLAAASGIATYHYGPATGHAIHINHGNHFQTRYYHLQAEGLLVSSPGVSVPVKRGEAIGLVGYSGNVRPAGVGGAHIHFMVIEDKNRDGDFADNIPDGLVDPYGWQGEGPDPWLVFTFSYEGVQRQGAVSRYLWRTSLTEAQTSVGPAGGEVSAEAVQVVVPPLTLSDVVDFFIRPVPPMPVHEGVEPLGEAARITATDGAGVAIKRFSQPLEIRMSYTDADMARFASETVHLYSSSDGAQWQKEQTVIHPETRQAVAQVDHLTYFTLAGEPADTTPPQTIAKLMGQGNAGVFRSKVEITLSSTDAHAAVDHTMYAWGAEPGAWHEYGVPLLIDSEGTHTLYFFSVDTAGRVEEVQELTVSIDMQAPEIYMRYDINTETFVFEGEEGAQLSFETDAVSAHDIAGNVHRMHYTLTTHANMSVLAISGHWYNDVLVHEGPQLYAITRGMEGAAPLEILERWEYVRMGPHELRIVPTAQGRMRLDTADPQIIPHESTMPLHIKTHHGTLMLYGTRTSSP